MTTTTCCRSHLNNTPPVNLLLCHLYLRPSGQMKELSSFCWCFWTFWPCRTAVRPIVRITSNRGKEQGTQRQHTLQL
ncbi:hypothetical protein EJB05_49043 [Eragrostis curvula]|uniref:Uncharacterized protein n=1 Tax=Eragrostis curvula TaxID=38414 RepID=A0A5J9T386_9POAL|nr:hypothetical protein EJB05_49043 [Eragrostis curvula]